MAATETQPLPYILYYIVKSSLPLLLPPPLLPVSFCFGLLIPSTTSARPAKSSPFKVLCHRMPGLWLISNHRFSFLLFNNLCRDNNNNKNIIKPTPLSPLSASFGILRSTPKKKKYHRHDSHRVCFCYPTIAAR